MNHQCFSDGVAWGAKAERAACRKAIAKPLRELRALCSKLLHRTGDVRLSDGHVVEDCPKCMAVDALLAINKATAKPKARKGKRA